MIYIFTLWDLRHFFLNITNFVADLVNLVQGIKKEKFRNREILIYLESIKPNLFHLNFDSHFKFLNLMHFNSTKLSSYLFSPFLFF